MVERVWENSAHMRAVERECAAGVAVEVVGRSIRYRAAVVACMLTPSNHIVKVAVEAEAGRGACAEEQVAVVHNAAGVDVVNEGVVDGEDAAGVGGAT
jgi:hypothetical protein